MASKPQKNLIRWCICAILSYTVPALASWEVDGTHISDPPFPYSQSANLQGKTVHFSSPKCGAFADDLYICQNSQLNIDKQYIINLKTVWLQNEKQHFAYRGKLNSHADGGSSIILTDINHDKLDDLIVWTGKRSGYGGPSYNVYLFNPKKQKFIYHQGLSHLSVMADTLFYIKGDKIYFSRKSGCCEYTNFVYQFKNNKLKLIKEQTISTR